MTKWITTDMGVKCILFINNLLEHKDPKNILRQAWLICEDFNKLTKHVNKEDLELEEYREKNLLYKKQIEKLQERVAEIRRSINTSYNVLKQMDNDLLEMLSTISHNMINDKFTLNNKIKEWWNDNIEYINDFWTTEQVRDLYSKSHACINLLRSTSFGMPLLESSACNSLCICGDVTPTNELVDSSYAMMIKPKGEIPIYPFINQVEQEVGLKNYYGYFEYPEVPYFWDFEVETVGQSLFEVYNNWSSYKKIDTRTPIINNWKWENSAIKLINILSKY
jgi:hypothetical protein